MLFRTLLIAVALTFISAAGSRAQDLRPLSSADKARVDSLLRAFDPNSYSFTYRYVNEAGQVETVRTGNALGLASVRQSNTVRAVPSEALAGTNTTINVFREGAGTNTVINVFRELAGLIAPINIFKEVSHNEMARELNLILQRYYVPAASEVRVAPVRIQRPEVRAPVNQPRPAQRQPR
jgi:hypothetical protein